MFRNRTMSNLDKEFVDIGKKITKKEKRIWELGEQMLKYAGKDYAKFDSLFEEQKRVQEELQGLLRTQSSLNSEKLRRLCNDSIDELDTQLEEQKFEQQNRELDQEMREFEESEKNKLHAEPGDSNYGSINEQSNEASRLIQDFPSPEIESAPVGCEDITQPIDETLSLSDALTLTESTPDPKGSGCCGCIGSKQMKKQMALSGKERRRLLDPFEIKLHQASKSCVSHRLNRFIPLSTDSAQTGRRLLSETTLELSDSNDSVGVVASVVCMVSTLGCIVRRYLTEEKSEKSN